MSRRIPRVMRSPEGRASFPARPFSAGNSISVQESNPKEGGSPSGKEKRRPEETFQEINDCEGINSARRGNDLATGDPSGKKGIRPSKGEANPRDNGNGASPKCQSERASRSESKGSRGVGALRDPSFFNRILHGEDLRTHLCRIQVQLAGCDFLGIQQGLHGNDLVLFVGPYDTTLAVPIHDLALYGSETIRKAIRLSNQAWHEADETFLDSVAWG
jgi:hypothetical protein